MCRAPTSALYVLSGRGHAVQCVTPEPVKHCVHSAGQAAGAVVTE